MNSKLYFGQYRNRDTILHSIDPRIKIVYVFALSILAFLSNNIKEIAFFSLFILLCLLLAKIDAGTIIKGLRPFYFVLIFILIMYLLFSPNQLNRGIIAIWRFLMFILISMVLTFTTKISSLILALEKLSRPLKAFGIKPRNIATMVSIAIRFIPVMFVNFEKIREAMASRLADFKKMKHIKILIMQVLVKMISSASSLSDAMYSRLYDEDIENKRMLKLNRYDYTSMVVIATLIMIIY